MADKAFLVDTTKCIGCKACQVACKQWNNLPAEESTSFLHQEYTYPIQLSAITFNHVIFSSIERRDNTVIWQMMHKKCYHCEISNCMTVCPSKAIYKNDHWVVIDHDKCIGCGECEKACIYNVPHVSVRDYNEYGTDKFITRGKAYKCHACTIKFRDIPACVSACPSGALEYGFRITMAENALRRIKVVSKEFPNASIYGLKQFGGLHVITILKDRPQKYGLETRPKPINSSSVNRINKIYTILSLFIPNSPLLRRFAFRVSKKISG